MSEAELRQKIVTACRIMDGMGLTEGFGHMSARLPDSDRILITPAMGPGMAQAELLLTFALDGSRVDEIDTPAALETPMHLAIYRARPDVGAICRTHSRHAVVMGVLNQPIATAHGFGGMLGLTINVHQEIDLIVDAAMGDAVADSLGDDVALLLRGNGALATGSDIEHAAAHAIYLEEAAMIAVLGGGKAQAFTPSELEKRARWYGNEARRAWDYYAQKFA
jgi:ribulose-5-phosphate 4-epimerase/fuculose-1-phosphate aldolase